VSHPANTLTAWSFIANGASPTTSSAPTAERGIAQLVCGPSSTSTPRPVHCVVSTCTRCGAIETVTLCASHTPVGTSLVLGCAITVVPRTARSAAAATTYSIARSVTPSSTRAIDKVGNPAETHTAPEAEALAAVQIANLGNAVFSERMPCPCRRAKALFAFCGADSRVVK